MSGAIYTATSGALAYQMRLDVLSNNLSNIGTVGFKEDRTVFRAYLPASPNPIDETLQSTLMSEKPTVLESYQVSNALVAFEGTITDFSPGQLKQTGNAFDLAIDGNGFFCIQTPDGVQYTRKGNFTLNDEGVLSTQEGLAVLGNGGEIRFIDGKEFFVDKEGSISIDGEEIDTLKVINFDDRDRLRKVGNTLFESTDPNMIEEKADGFSINQGFIELSNVDSISVMLEMIEVLRGYESYKKAIQSVDDITSKAINEVGQPA